MTGWSAGAIMRTGGGWSPPPSPQKMADSKMWNSPSPVVTGKFASVNNGSHRRHSDRHVSHDFAPAAAIWSLCGTTDRFHHDLVGSRPPSPSSTGKGDAPRASKRWRRDRTGHRSQAVCRWITRGGSATLLSGAESVDDTRRRSSRGGPPADAKTGTPGGGGFSIWVGEENHQRRRRKAPATHTSTNEVFRDSFGTVQFRDTVPQTWRRPASR